MVTLTIVTMFALLFLGVPVVFSVCFAAILGVATTDDLNMVFAIRKMVTGLDSFPMLACPFFILAGDLMSAGGMSERIVRFSNATLGFIRGGLGHVTVGASMLFAGVSGSAVADTSAMGALLIPQMKKQGYPSAFAASLQAASGSLGIIIPPSLVMILYGAITGESVAKLFMGGAVPGFIFGIGMMVIVYVYATKWGWRGTGRFDVAEVWAAAKSSSLALVAPIIIMGGILGGVFTPTEAGVVACIYGAIVGRFVYKSLTWNVLWESLVRTGEIAGYVLIMLAAATFMGQIFTLGEVPEKIMALLLSLTDNPTLIFIMILMSIVFAGFFLDVFAMLALFVPVLMPIAKSMHYDPIHFGVLVCICTVLGAATPPVGTLLFITMAIAETSMSQMIRYIIPFIVMMVTVIFSAVFFHEIVTFLPSLI